MTASIISLFSDEYQEVKSNVKRHHIGEIRNHVASVKSVLYIKHKTISLLVSHIGRCRNILRYTYGEFVFCFQKHILTW